MDNIHDTTLVGAKVTGVKDNRDRRPSAPDRWQMFIGNATMLLTLEWIALAGPVHLQVTLPAADKVLWCREQNLRWNLPVRIAAAD